MAGDIWTIARMLAWMTDFFAKKEIESPRLNAELLISHAVGQDRLYLYTHFDKPLERTELDFLRDAVKKRASGICAAYIVGNKEFMGLPLEVTPAVLVPQPDTEILVDRVLELRGDIPLTVADLGTGSGAIMVSLLHYRPQWRGIATDISGEALAVARKNLAAHACLERCECLQGDFWKPLLGRKVDVLVSNPPYIPTEVIGTLPMEVRCEPHLALDGGSDGLDFYRALAQEAAAYVVPGGLCAVEIGHDQAAAVQALLAANPAFTKPQVHRDLGGHNRVVTWEVKV